MNLRTTVLMVIALSAALTLIGCTQGSAPAPAPQGAAQAPAAPAPGAAMPASPAIAGTVAETMDSGGYTYVLVETGSEKVWAAGPETKVKVGDKVSLAPGAPMTNFHSKTLNRDFPVIHFVPAITVGDAPPAAAAAPAGGDAMPPGHPPVGPAGSEPVGVAASPAMPTGHPQVGAAETPEGIDLTGIQKADGGKTVAEVYAEKAALAGKEVKVRGRVVKFNAQIMGKNWLHLRDGTGDKDTNDLTVTVAGDIVKPGDLLVVTGVLAVDKDFGAGYRYTVIVEDAKITPE